MNSVRRLNEYLASFSFFLLKFSAVWDVVKYTEEEYDMYLTASVGIRPFHLYDLVGFTRSTLNAFQDRHYSGVGYLFARLEQYIVAHCLIHFYHVQIIV